MIHNEKTRVVYKGAETVPPIPPSPQAAEEISAAPADPEACTFLTSGNAVSDAPQDATEAAEFLGAWVNPAGGTSPGLPEAPPNPFAELAADNPFAGPSDDQKNPFADVDAAPAGSGTENPFTAAPPKYRIENPTDSIPPWEM